MIGNEGVKDLDVDPYMREINRALVKLEMELSKNKEIVKVEVEPADEFWGFYIRGFNIRKEEVYTDVCALDYDIPEDIGLKEAVEYLFINSIALLLKEFDIEADNPALLAHILRKRGVDS